MIDFKIQYVSDIHLEFFEEYEQEEWKVEKYLKPVARYLALCGDIGNPMRPQYREFLSACSKIWKAVFIVTGNHEYYDYPSDQFGQKYTKAQRDEEIRNICDAYPNVYFLRRGQSHRVEEGVWMVGATLWTHMKVDQFWKAQVMMNDYKTIWKEEGSFWKASDCEREHQLDKAWIVGEIERVRLDHPGDAVVVLTHHLPSYDCIHPEYKEDENNYCYASALDEYICAPVIAWLSGHTHKSLRRYKGDIFLGVNPWGYRHEKNEERAYEAVYTAGDSKDVIEKNYEISAEPEEEEKQSVSVELDSLPPYNSSVDEGVDFL